MRKALPALLLFLLCAASASAQSTTVSGQVTDGGGQSWNNGTYSWSFVPNPQYPVGPYTWTGGTLRTTFSGSLSSSGSYSVSLPSNTAISPISTQWQLQVCPQATSPCYTLPPVTISGTTQTVNVTPPAILINLQQPSANPPTAYSSSELTGAALDSSYYNLTTTREQFCQAVSGNNCTLWVDRGASVSPGVFPRWDQLIDPIVSFNPNFNSVTATFCCSTGLWDWGTLPMAVPGSSTFTPTTTRQIGYNTSAGNLLFNNGGVATVALIDPATTPNAGDLASYLVSGGKVTLGDTPVNSGSGTSILQITNNSTQVNDSVCVVSLGPPIEWDNCTPGVPINLQTGNYNIDPTNDRGTAVISNDASTSTITWNAALSEATGFNGNWFDFHMNKNAGQVTLTLTSPSTWDSTGTQNEVLNEGENVSVFTDPSSGIAYPKFSPGRLTAGSGVSFTRSPYGLTISATGSGGTITGSGTNNTMTKWTGASSVGNSSVTDDGTNPTRAPDGVNTATSGDFEEYTVDTGGVTAGRALCVTANVDASGRPKVLACSHTATQPGAGFVGIAQSTVAATGTVAVCWTVNCSATFDNSATVLDEAILSVTTDGELHDTGLQTATGGQPNFAVLKSGSGTIPISLTGMLAQNPNGGGSNGKGTNVQVAGNNTKQNANFVAGTGVTITPVSSGNTTTITVASSASGGYNQIDSNGTSVTQRTTLNFIPAGSANVSCVDNSGAVRTDCTVTGINGPPSPTVNDIPNSPYTIQNSDNSWRDKFRSGANTVSIAQAGSIGSSPYIGHKYGAAQTCTTCATSAFSQSSNDLLQVAVGWDSATITIPSVPTDTAGDTFVLVATPQLNVGTDHKNLAIYRALSIAASGSNTVTVTMSSSGVVGIDVEEYSILNTDAAASFSSGSVIASVNIPISYTNVVTTGVAYGQNDSCPSGWTDRSNFGISNGAFIHICDKLLSSTATSLFAPYTAAQSNGATAFQADYSIASAPLFTAGWYNVDMNVNNGGVVTITPTTSSINTQSNLIVVPGEWCSPMSDGANYITICGTIPNYFNNGEIGTFVGNGRDFQSLSGDRSAQTLYTPATAARMHFEGTLTCSSVTAGQLTLTLAYTDTNSASQTRTAVADCTSGSTTNNASLIVAFRAKAGTGITYAVTHANSQPSYQVDAEVFQATTN